MVSRQITRFVYLKLKKKLKPLLQNINIYKKCSKHVKKIKNERGDQLSSRQDNYIVDANKQGSTL